MNASQGLSAPWLLALLALALALAFVVGRRIESGRDAGWDDAARRVQGTFVRPCAAEDLARFGPAPWTEWAGDGELQCLRAIHGGAPSFALLQIRYSVRQRRGEEQPDDWYEVSVAAVPLPRPVPSAGLQPLPVQGDYTGVHNGRTAYVWKKGRLGAGASLAAEELPQLLQAAQAATGSR